MRGYNPAIVAYRNLDIDVLLGKEKKVTSNTGLLAPTKSRMNKSKSKSDNPLYRVANHVKILRDKRNEIKNA
tara:strand:+ start:1193 stop:1408 length:216 start_codon:yes stop_codon:yes gene_type:complete